MRWIATPEAARVYPDPCRWQRSFAWRPVLTDDGVWVWLEHYSWRQTEFGGCDGFMGSWPDEYEIRLVTPCEHGYGDWDACPVCCH